MGDGARVRVGIGGWTFEPWRGTFYPERLPQAQELVHASRHLTSIEVNGTFYGSQKPTTFRRWAEEAPDGFVFALKGPRFAINRKALAEAGPSIDRFVQSGIAELGPKLGPILWQLPETKKFEPDDLEAFLALMPREVAGLRLRHALEARHASFVDARLAPLLRKYGVALVAVDDPDYPLFTELTADFAYARLRRSAETEPTGYDEAGLARWTDHFQALAHQGTDAFVYFIAGAKVRNPAAAMAMIARLGGQPAMLRPGEQPGAAGPGSPGGPLTASGADAPGAPRPWAPCGR